MALSCCQLKPPTAPPKEATRSHLPRLRRACVAAAAACVVIGAAAGVTADGNGNGMAIATADTRDMVLVRAQEPARWSDRRQCPPWHANSLENIVPENLPRPSARRRFNGIAAPAASPDAVIPFLALRSGMGCFSL